jgi:tRNA (guanine37-N1)-methyltransferase
MKIDIISIFPGMFEPVLNESIIKRAREKGRVRIAVHDLREYTKDKHRTVDDRPFGGGAGMVMRPEPIFRAVEKITGRKGGKKPLKGKKPVADGFTVILMCPQGRPLTQQLAKKLSRSKHLVLICGRYEGVDERIREKAADEAVSIGDYVLTGGELPAMVLVDSVVRLLPGVLGDKNSLNFESFEGNLLEYPQYTRPALYRGLKVPQVLLSGDHTKIAQWRQQQSLARTSTHRPDLLSMEPRKEKHRNG